MEKLILEIKNKVALYYGYDTNVFGSFWKDAMMFTYRTKRQLELYESVIKLLGDSLNTENTEQVANSEATH